MLLSNNDIKRELIKRKNISIYPLKTDNIKGSSINLTASAYAWDVKSKITVVDQTKKKITIRANATVSIFTEEAIWVSRRIGGTYHPRVSLVAKGLSNVSTTLDPQWYGLSLVTISNSTDEDIIIRVGESFVSVMLYYLNSPATKGIIDNQASRPDIFSRFTLTEEEKEFLDQQWHRSYHGIIEKMKNSENYQSLVKDKTKFRKSIFSLLSHPLIVGILSGVIAGVVVFTLGMN